MQDFLEGDEKHLADFGKDFEKPGKDWVGELKLWKKMIKQVQDNEEFISGSSSSEFSDDELEAVIITAKGFRE